MFPKLRRVALLRRREAAELAEAQWMLVYARVLLLTRPRGGLLATQPPFEACPTPREAEVARRLAVALQRAARHGIFRPTCLVRSLALCRLLNAHGIRGGRIQVGVRWTGGKFDAHAWVEYGGRVLGDRAEHVSAFAPLAAAGVRRA